MARTKSLESILVECPGCDRQATIDATMLESRLDRPLSMNSVGQLYGTRIPARDIAEMLANGDGIGAIRDAWPVLTVEQIEAAALYTRAYPRRGRPRTPPAWRSRTPIASGEAALDELPGSR